MSSTCGFIYFTYNNEQYELFIAENSHVYQKETGYDKPATVIDLWAWGDAWEIIKTIVKNFGGWYMENHCNPNAEFYGFKENLNLIKTS